jgi:hypothetical protein
MNFIIAGAAMAASNFLYQAVHHQDFMTAFERSWFQICALFTAWLLAYLFTRPVAGGVEK